MIWAVVRSDDDSMRIKWWGEGRDHVYGNDEWMFRKLSKSVRYGGWLNQKDWISKSVVATRLTTNGSAPKTNSQLCDNIYDLVSLSHNSVRSSCGLMNYRLSSYHPVAALWKTVWHHGHKRTSTATLSQLPTCPLLHKFLKRLQILSAF